MRAIIPEPAADWDFQCRRAHVALQLAADDVVRAQHVSEMAGVLGRLAAARAAFGRAMLALDRRRRPQFYRRSRHG